MMLVGGLRGGDELYAAAAGRDQAGHVARKMRLIGDATPELSGSVDVQNYRVITPRTGAVLDVISSDLSTSWGKTPRWLFVDEIANHDSTEGAKGFIEALLTSLPKRRDSVCVAATTPSSPNHWARELWDTACEDPLWRTSMVAGPAPWQDPAELEGERRRLSDSLWRRLFLCEWAELDDQMATLEQVRACIGHEGALPCDPAYSYVHGVDLSYARDVTAVATCHAEDRHGKPVLVLDRLRAWRPRKGFHVPLGEVAQYVTQCVREYGGLVHVDPYQGVQAVQEWRNQGHQVKIAAFSAQENSRRGQLLLGLIRELQLDLPEDQPELFREITSLRLQEGSTPGVLKLATDGSSQGHFDRSMALMLCAQELMSRPTGSYLSLYGEVTKCPDCLRFYRAERDTCQWCHAANPAAPGPRGQGAPVLAAGSGSGESVPLNVQSGSWASAYYPENARKCVARGHVFAGSEGDACPQCRGGGRSAGRGLFAGLR